MKSIRRKSKDSSTAKTWERLTLKHPSVGQTGSVCNSLSTKTHSVYLGQQEEGPREEKACALYCTFAATFPAFFCKAGRNSPVLYWFRPPCLNIIILLFCLGFFSVSSVHSSRLPYIWFHWLSFSTDCCLLSLVSPSTSNMPSVSHTYLFLLFSDPVLF